MPRNALTEQDLEQQRRRLCAAAMSLYKSRGYEAVSLRNLARRLKISHTLAYRYFDDKQALFARMRADCVRELLARIRAVDPVARPPVARIHAIARDLLAYVREKPEHYQLMFALPQPPLARHPQLLQAQRELVDYIVGVIQLGVDAGQIHGDARTVMHCAWAAAHGALMLQATNQLVHGRSIDELVLPLLETMIGPLLGNGAAVPLSRLRERVARRAGRGDATATPPLSPALSRKRERESAGPRVRAR